jgi:hypothetical protein
MRTNLKKTLIKALITLVLIAEAIYIYIGDNATKISEEFHLLSTQKDKYVEVLNNKKKELDKSGLYAKLKTDIKFNSDTTVDITFIHNEAERKEYNLSDKKVFGTQTLIDLYNYHKYIHRIYQHTKNTTILDSYEYMIKNIVDILQSDSSLYTADIKNSLKKIKKDNKIYFDEMHKTESELISFDNEIEKILKLNYETYNHNKPNIENIAEVESKKMILFFKMFKNSNNLYINIPKTINDNPFIKFYSFIDMYDNVYNTHKDLVKKYNQNIDRNTKIYKFVLLITALVVILLTFYKDKIDE